MTLSKKQLDNDPKIKYRKYFWIWERDMLEHAKDHPAWRKLCHELGYSDEKIDAPWTHEDAGKHIRYMEIPNWKSK